MLTPDSEEALADAIRSAAAPFRIAGGGTRMVSEPTLSTRALRGIELYEPGALTLVAKAGTPVAEIEAALAEENQRLAFEPMDHRGIMGSVGEPTIGGVVAMNVSGPRRIQAGACRDSLIGVRFVDGDGTLMKNGGRVMKNVTGYDLVKLMAGSYGTLGVITEVSFKLLPGVAATQTLNATGPDAAQAVEAMSKALGSPFDVSGAAYDPQSARVSLRLEGFEASVAYRIGKLRTLLDKFGEITVIENSAKSRMHWDAIRDLHALLPGTGDIWRVSVKPSDAPKVVAAIEGTLQLDWGGGLIWACVAPETDLRAALGGISGHATLIRASQNTRAKLGTFHPEPAPLARISRDLRAKFDPRGILNPNMMEGPQALSLA